jgi:two-component system, NarL family, response regulator DegU
MPQALRIVFADDHPIFRAGLRQVLAVDRDIEVVAEVADGESALGEIRKRKPHVAVLDFDLPARSGLEVARELRRLRDDTPVVILTGHRKETLFEEAIAAGVRGYVLKDNAAANLLECLRSVAEGGTFFSPTFSRYLVARSQRADALRKEVRGLEALSPAERRILRLIALNRSTREIATELFLSPATVETHRKHICSKLDLHGPNKLLQFAIEHRAELT